MAKCQIIPIFVPHMGCPNDCVFCNQRKIAGQEEEATPEKVRQIIETAILEDTETIKQIAFYGGSFTAIDEKLQNELLSIALEFIEKGLVRDIRISTRPDHINDEILTRLKGFGVTTIELGAQSMSDEVLCASKRGHTASDTENSAKLIGKHGFSLGLQIMTGLPLEKPQDARENAKKIANLKPDFVRIYPVAVIRETELCDMLMHGTYEAISLDDAVKNCADMAEIFDTAGIKIIRIGLNATEELSGGSVVAGAYHPSLGEMVYSEIYLRKILDKISDTQIKNSNEVHVLVNFRDVSKAIGQKKANLARLKALYPECSFKIQEHEDREFNGIMINYK